MTLLDRLNADLARVEHAWAERFRSATAAAADSGRRKLGAISDDRVRDRKQKLPVQGSIDAARD